MNFPVNNIFSESNLSSPPFVFPVVIRNPNIFVPSIRYETPRISPEHPTTTARTTAAVEEVFIKKKKCTNVSQAFTWPIDKRLVQLYNSSNCLHRGKVVLKILNKNPEFEKHNLAPEQITNRMSHLRKRAKNGILKPAKGQIGAIPGDSIRIERNIEYVAEKAEATFAKKFGKEPLAIPTLNMDLLALAVAKAMETAKSLYLASKSNLETSGSVTEFATESSPSKKDDAFDNGSKVTCIDKEATYEDLVKKSEVDPLPTPHATLALLGAPAGTTSFLSDDKTKETEVEDGFYDKGVEDSGRGFPGTFHTILATRDLAAATSPFQDQDSSDSDSSLTSKDSLTVFTHSTGPRKRKDLAATASAAKTAVLSFTESGNSGKAVAKKQRKA